MKKNHDIITIDATLMHATEKAYLFDTGKIGKDGKPLGTWVPKSGCEFSDGQLELPEWLALEKGLI